MTSTAIRCQHAAFRHSERLLPLIQQRPTGMVAWLLGETPPQPEERAPPHPRRSVEGQDPLNTAEDQPQLQC